MNVIIDDNILSAQDINVINENVFGELPFFYTPVATTKKFPFLCHTLAHRNDVSAIKNSVAYEFFENILIRMCEKHNIPYLNPIRAAVNCTYPDNRYEFWDPHVDNTFNHKVFILYLNDLTTKDSSGNTIIFKEKYSETNFPDICDVENDMDKFNIMYEVPPKLGRCVLFDGDHYHTIRPPSNGDMRFICIFNFQ